MPDLPTLRRVLSRLASMPRWWHVMAIVLLAVLVVAIPPARRAAANVASHSASILLAPITPSLKGFEQLPEPSTVRGAAGNELGRIGAEHREPVPLEALPDHVWQAVLSAEDRAFYHHAGVDPAGVARAAWANIQGEELHGGSTITQQLAKMNYTGADRTLWRKLRETLYALRLEGRYGKDELLERYLNEVYFGDGAYGIALAAEGYFGVPPQELDHAQAAMLAGKIRAPNALDPQERPEDVEARRNHILANMERNGWIDEETLEGASAAPLGVVDGDLLGGPADHFLEYVRLEAEGLEELGGSEEARRHRLLVRGGLEIETTLDLRTQEATEGVVRELLGEPEDPDVAVASVAPGDGAIRTYFGGLDGEQRYDLVGEGRRQPGSSFKPFTYLGMLEEGIHPDSRFRADSPATVDCEGRDWEVQNYPGLSASGRITVDRALVRSVNVVFARLIAETGPEATADAAATLGIDPDEVDPAHCALALGGLQRGVTPLEQAAAFATFAADGAYAEPYAILRIRDREGTLLYEREPEVEQVIDEDYAKVVNNGLQNVVRSGTGTAASIGRPVAGKTGTTDNHTNAWFVGYVPQQATAVWVGHAEGDVPMEDVRGSTVSGGTFPARIFSLMMTHALEGVPVEELSTMSPDRLRLRPLHTPSATPSPSPSRSPSPTPAASPSPSRSPSPTPAASPSPSPTPSPSPSPSPTPSATPDDEDGGEDSGEEGFDDPREGEHDPDEGDE